MCTTCDHASAHTRLNSHENCTMITGDLGHTGTRKGIERPPPCAHELRSFGQNNHSFMHSSVLHPPCRQVRWLPGWSIPVSTATSVCSAESQVQPYVKLAALSAWWHRCAQRHTAIHKFVYDSWPALATRAIQAKQSNSSRAHGRVTLRVNTC